MSKEIHTKMLTNILIITILKIPKNSKKWSEKQDNNITNKQVKEMELMPRNYKMKIEKKAIIRKTTGTIITENNKM